MHILSLELSKFKRLALNHIDYIKITPESKIQLILGTNGSGKSSIIEELTPLPASPADYLKGGFKIIEIAHKNSHYLLKSMFHTTGNKFHFIKDEIDLLGDGGTVTVYKDLVYQEFGITVDIHDLITGIVKFTDMDTGKRRNWLTRFSDADYTYAIKYYSKLKEQHRDLLGSIKLYQARLVQENEKILSPEQELKYREELKVLNETLAYFLEMKTPSSITKQDAINEISNIDVKLKNITELTIRNRNQHMLIKGDLTSLEHIDEELIQVQSTIQTSQHQINQICEVIEQLHKSIDALKSTNVKSSSELDEQLDTVCLEIEQSNNQLFFKELIFEDPQVSYKALMAMYEYLTDIVINLASNKDRQYSREGYQQAQDLITNHTNQLNQLTLRETDLFSKKKELEHLKQHNETECPECHHKWFRGFSEKEYQKILIEIEVVQGSIKKTSEALEKVQAYQEKNKTYLELYRSYNHITAASDSLNSFWRYLYDNSIIFDNPKQIIKLMEQLKQDLLLHSKLRDLKKSQKDIIDLKILFSKNQETNLVKLYEDSEKNDKELYRLNKTMQSKRHELSRLINVKKISLFLDSQRKLLEELLAEREAKSQSLYDLFKREALNECVQATQKEIAQREHIISRVDVQKALVDNIQLQIFEQNEQAEIIKLAIKELSPTEGLIAKGLTGFINHFVAQMNSFIKKVWLYPLELTPIIPDEEADVDLDYKFQVKVNDDSVIPDISRTSSGMKEIINLAYRIVAMQYLKLEEAPLILDEFGKALDAKHRDSVHYVITNLLTSANFSQIYMVSHYESSYGSLVNTDILVLSDANIVLDKNSIYNKHVIMH